MTHPYRSFPPRQFWNRSVETDFRATDVADFDGPLLTRGDRIVTAGSCFAANLVPYLEKAGFTYLRTELQHPLFKQIPPENFSYAKFSAAYGNVYTTAQLHQLLLRALGEFSPVERMWESEGRFVDPFRPGLKYKANSEPEFEALTAAHLRAVKRAFLECDVFVFTLGLTEAWVSKADGAVFPACPGTIAGAFDPEKHAFHNFDVSEVSASLEAFIARMKDVNPDARIILTVSPVPLVATAESRHVLAATIYSKSVLRVAAETATRRHPHVRYFPAYEIVTGPQAPSTFFEPDFRNVSAAAVQTVMDAFLAACEPPPQPRSRRPRPPAPPPRCQPPWRTSNARRLGRPAEPRRSAHAGQALGR